MRTTPALGLTLLALLAPSALAAIVKGTGGSDRLVGTERRDLLRGFGGGDTLSGRESGDTLQAGAGADTLRGGPGEDVLKGRNGPDLLRARDGQPDLLHCGAGAADKAIVDRAEDGVFNCERVVEPR
jgi:Ca2+-binding RTX toxin-like protein